MAGVTAGLSAARARPSGQASEHAIATIIADEANTLPEEL